MLISKKKATKYGGTCHVTLSKEFLGQDIILLDQETFNILVKDSKMEAYK